jgi:glycerol kinase
MIWRTCSVGSVVVELTFRRIPSLNAKLGELRVDGGMTRNDLLMQFQADILGSAVAVPAIAEMTATGAVYAAGLATGFWSDLDELHVSYTITRRWQSQMDEDERARGVAPGETVSNGRCTWRREGGVPGAV